MTTGDELILIMGMMLVTFGVRYPVLAILGRLELPPRILNALRYVPVAVLTAITVPAVLAPDGQVNLSVDNAYMVASVFAVLVSLYSKNLLLTIVLGMGLFLLWRLLFAV